MNEQLLEQLLSYLKTLEVQIGLGVFAFALLLLLIFRKKSSKKGSSSASTSVLQKKNDFASKIKGLLLGSDKRLEDLIPDLEEVLLTADVGVSATEKLLQGLVDDNSIQSKEDALIYLKSQIQNKLTAKDEFHIPKQDDPYVIYLVGVNGVGKTTTIGKLAKQFKEQGHHVMLVAADTFRAAAVEQLKIWSDRNDVSFVGGKTGADPSSVIVDGLRSAKAKNINVVLVDTAGRLQTKQNLMTELQKMVRMSEKELGRNPDQIFLVVDAITGQNGFQQAQIFMEAIPLSGVVLTKYDATSKGGIILSIVEQTKIPIRFIGLGEGIHDLKPFNAKDFTDRLFS